MVVSNFLKEETVQLKDKITSKQDLVKVLTNYEFQDYERRLAGEARISPAWWAVREEARILKDIYETTDALCRVNRHAKVFAHVSTTDRTKVAFTPDKAFGERDAQLTMNFGKMVQRVIPFASDEYVKTLTESHNADISDEVEWITGPEIANVYATTNVNSCMTKKRWDFHDPALAYDAPGIKMAVLRDSEGVINARCMIYEEGDDKRLIRNYGDGRLFKRLTRLGYTPGGWQGVKFRTIVEEHNHTGEGHIQVAVPYLDSMNGPARREECTVILLDGILQGVKREHLDALVDAGVHITVPSTSGAVSLIPASSAEFTRKDIITGGDLNVLTDETVLVLYNGELGTTKKANVKDGYTLARKLEKGAWKILHIPVNQTFSCSYTISFDGPEEREYYGFRKLSKSYYDTDDWYKGDTREVSKRGAALQYIKASDAVHLYDGEGGTYVHHSEIDKKLHTRVADHLGEKWYVTSNVEVLRTPSKAKVVTAIHQIKLGWNGWDYRRNLGLSLKVFDCLVFAGKLEGQRPELQTYLEELAKQKIQTYVAENQGESLQRLFAVLCNRQGCIGYVYPSSTNEYSTRAYYGVNDVESMDLDTFKEYVADCARVFSGNRVLKMLVQWVRIAIAEMEAVNGEEPLTTAPTLEFPELVITKQLAA